jgi:hypothetical protein
VSQNNNPHRQLPQNQKGQKHKAFDSFAFSESHHQEGSKVHHRYNKYQYNNKKGAPMSQGNDPTKICKFYISYTPTMTTKQMYGCIDFTLYQRRMNPVG